MANSEKEKPVRRGIAIERFVAGALAYAVALALFVKIARAAFIAQATRSAGIWLTLPLTLGQDLLFVAVAAFVAHAVARIPWRSVRLGVGLLLLELMVVVHIFDVGAYQLTGSPITFQRIMGDEGATLADLGLVSKSDLLLGIGAIAAWSALIWPALHYCPRWSLLRRVAAIRPLIVLLVIGLAASVVEARFLRRGGGLETQSAVTLVASIFESDAYEGYAISEAQWKRLLTPRVKPKDPERPPIALPSARPKNVIVFLAEGIPFKHTGLDGRHQPNPTPKLTRRARWQGFVFTRFYSHWHASNQAIFSLVCSSLPPLTGNIMNLKPRIDCGEFSQVMHDRGLHAGLFHAGDFSFYNKLALLGRRNYEIELDAEGLIQRNRSWTRTRWGTDDRAMVEETLNWVDTLGKDKNFAAFLISIAPHYPFDQPASWKYRPFKGKGEQPRYLNSVAFIDSVFEQLARGLDARGLSDDTLLVFLGDHGVSVAEPSRITPGRRTFYEANLHIPLVLINPRLFPASLPESARSSDRVGGLMDLLPTLLDVLGKKPDPRHHGQSLFRNEGWPRRAVFSAFKGRFIGFIENDYKYIYEVPSNRTQYYDLASDPEELRDISDRFSARMKQYAQDAFTIAQGLRAQINLAPVLKEKVKISQLYQLFPRNVEANIDRAGTSTACRIGSGGKNRICGDFGALFTEANEFLQGSRRRCLWVRIPENATLRLRIKDPTTLSLLTSMDAAISRNNPPTTRFRIETDVDGQSRSAVFLGPKKATYVAHRRATTYLQYTISRTHKGKPDQVCLQLTELREK